MELIYDNNHILKDDSSLRVSIVHIYDNNFDIFSGRLVIAFEVLSSCWTIRNGRISINL